MPLSSSRWRRPSRGASTVKIPHSWWQTVARLLLVLSPFLLFFLVYLVDRYLIVGP